VLVGDFEPKHQRDSENKMSDKETLCQKIDAVLSYYDMNPCLNEKIRFSGQQSHIIYNDCSVSFRMGYYKVLADIKRYAKATNDIMVAYLAQQLCNEADEMQKFIAFCYDTIEKMGGEEVEDAICECRECFVSKSQMKLIGCKRELQYSA
jgi:hypothetical protein